MAELFEVGSAGQAAEPDGLKFDVSRSWSSSGVVLSFFWTPSSGDRFQLPTAAGVVIILFRMHARWTMSRTWSSLPLPLVV